MRQRLRRDARSIAVVNAIVAALENYGEPFLHLSIGGLPRGVFLGWSQRVVRGRRDFEDALRGIWMQYPFLQNVSKQFLPRAKEFVEERLNCLEAQDRFSLHHLPRRHAPLA